jgi:flagellar assembly factor FliW
MKVSPDLCSTELSTDQPRVYRLPEGLVGFSHHRSFTLSSVPDQAPFLWLHLQGPDPLNFVVLEPNGVFPDYDLELFDEDAQALGIKESGDALVFNIVTVRNDAPQDATVNLAGPIVVNRHTGIGRQCILANYFRYSAHHPLVESSDAAR